MSHRTVSPCIIYTCDGCGKEDKSHGDKHCFNSAPDEWVRIEFYGGVGSIEAHGITNQDAPFFCKKCFKDILGLIMDYKKDSEKFGAIYDDAGEEIKPQEG